MTDMTVMDAAAIVVAPARVSRMNWIRDFIVLPVCGNDFGEKSRVGRVTPDTGHSVRARGRADPGTGIAIAREQRSAKRHGEGVETETDGMTRRCTWRWGNLVPGSCAPGG